MTIPIVPGPFSFLAQAGQALGQFGEEKEKARQQILKEAQDNLTRMIEMRAKGIMPPEAFASPEAMKIYHVLGIAPASAQPTSGEMTEDIRKRFLAPTETAGIPNIPIPNLQGGPPVGQFSIKPTGTKIPTAQRLAAGLPTQSQLVGEDVATAKGTAQLGAMESGGAAGRAVSGVPSEQVAQAAETTGMYEMKNKQDVYQNSLADRMVDSALTVLGKDPIALAQLDASGQKAIIDEAWRTAETDAKSKGEVINEQLTRPYLQAALAARVREAQRDVSSRIAAQNAGQGSSNLDDFVRLWLGQTTAIDAEIRSLPAPSDYDRIMATGYAQEIAKVANDPEKLQKLLTNPAFTGARDAYNRVNQYEQTIKQLNQERQDLRNKGLKAITGATGVGQPTTVTGARKLTNDQINAAVAKIRSQNIPVEQLDKDVQSGLLSASDALIIKTRLGQTGTSTHKSP